MDFALKRKIASGESTVVSNLSEKINSSFETPPDRMKNSIRSIIHSALFTVKTKTRNWRFFRMPDALFKSPGDRKPGEES